MPARIGNECHPNFILTRVPLKNRQDLCRDKVKHMKCNLTAKQKETARQLLKAIREGHITESFVAMRDPGGLAELHIANQPFVGAWSYICKGDAGDIEALENANLMLVRWVEDTMECTITGALEKAVDTNFAEVDEVTAGNAFSPSTPSDLAFSLQRLRQKYPDPMKLGFLIMRFAPTKPIERIVKVIKDTAKSHGLDVVRADEHEFHSDLFGNVRTFLHGCSFGISVHERIETDEPNANIGLEVGYLMAMNKPVLLLKDKTLETLQSDLAGKLYKQFDPHDPEGTIPLLLKKWFGDYGIVAPPLEMTPEQAEKFAPKASS